MLIFLNVLINYIKLLILNNLILIYLYHRLYIESLINFHFMVLIIIYFLIFIINPNNIEDFN